MPLTTTSSTLPAMNSPASFSSPSSSSSSLSAAGLREVYFRRKKLPSTGAGEIAAAELALPESQEDESCEVSAEEEGLCGVLNFQHPFVEKMPCWPKVFVQCTRTETQEKKQNMLQVYSELKQQH